MSRLWFFGFGLWALAFAPWPFISNGICAPMAGEPFQTFFIYPDDAPHPPPADRAAVALCDSSDTTRVTAYAGAVWGAFNLSGRDYCIAWEVGPADEFDRFLEGHGYRRYREPGAP